MTSQKSVPARECPHQGTSTSRKFHIFPAHSAEIFFPPTTRGMPSHIFPRIIRFHINFPSRAGNSHRVHKVFTSISPRPHINFTFSRAQRGKFFSRIIPGMPIQIIPLTLSHHFHINFTSTSHKFHTATIYYSTPR